VNLGDTKKYVIAVKREFRGNPPVDLRDVLSSAPGIRLLGLTGTRAQVEATTAGIESLSARLGNSCFIEQSIERLPADGT
jgi:hypothetical protein